MSDNLAVLSRVIARLNAGVVLGGIPAPGPWHKFLDRVLGQRPLGSRKWSAYRRFARSVPASVLARADEVIE